MTDSPRRLAGISPRAFEHPLDRTALRALQKVPGLDWVIRKFMTAIGERRLRLLYLSSAVRVSEQQLPSIHASYRHVCDILDVDEPSELFVSHDPRPNATAYGVDAPFIVVTSGLLDIMDERELRCVLGHEQGHILCGHALYTTLLIVLVNLAFNFAALPGGYLAFQGIILALLEWQRKAELTCDRAGALVVQNPDVSYSVDMKLAGGKLSSEMNVAAFIEQAEEYLAHGDVLDGVLKLGNLLGRTHPFAVLRVAELKRWVDSGQYDQILGGDYPRRSEENDDTWLQNVRTTAEHYKDSVQSSTDPLIETFSDLVGGAAATGAGLLDALRGFRRGANDEQKPATEGSDDPSEAS